MPASARVTRRRLLRRLSIAGASASTVGLAGCADSAGDGDLSPNPRVVNTESEPQLEEAPGNREITVTILVHNADAAGTVEVTVEALTENGVVVDETTREYEMDRDEQEQYSFRMTVSGAAVGLRAEARPAD